MISIFYISRINLLSKKAHVHNIIKTCESLVRIRDIKIALINCYGSFEENKVKNDLLKEHNIRYKFPIISLNSLGIYFKRGQVKIINWIEVILANFSLIKFLLKKKKEIDVIYFRDSLLFLVIIFAKYFLRKSIFYEIHTGKKPRRKQFFINWMARISNGVIVITFALKKYYEKLNKNITVFVCGAAEKDSFPYYKSKAELRGELGLPLDKFIVGYVGSIGSTGHFKIYEIDKIIKALEFVPKKIIFIVIGDQDNKSKAFKDLAEEIGVAERVKFYPRMPRSKIPAYLLAFDVLIIAKPGQLPGDSPTKMFEYLAAERPIISCATEPILEVMHNNKNCLIVKTNSHKEWAERIKEIYQDKSLQNKLIKQAKKDSKIYTWENRGKIISEFIKSFNVKK